MPDLQVTIVGLGVIGGSIGLALQKTDLNLQITGHDKEPLNARQAQKLGCVHKTDWNLISACDQADLVILALPLSGIEETLRAIGSEVKPGCVITDTATVKAPLDAWAKAYLPDNAYLVGGDPIVASRQTGIEAAEANLFQKQTWCLTATPGTPSEALELITDIVTAMGAEPYFIDAAEHDGLLAATDHLPLVLMATLLNQVVDTPLFREMAKVGGPQLARITAPIMHQQEMLRDICLLNQANVSRWLSDMQQALESMQAMIDSGDPEQLDAFFAAAQDNWVKWLKGEESETSNALHEESMMPSVRNMLFGRLRGPKPPK